MKIKTAENIFNLFDRHLYLEEAKTKLTCAGMRFGLEIPKSETQNPKSFHLPESASLTALNTSGDF